MVVTAVGANYRWRSRAADRALLGNKSGTTRLGVLIKWPLVTELLVQGQPSRDSSPPSMVLARGKEQVCARPASDRARLVLRRPVVARQVEAELAPEVAEALGVHRTAVSQ